MSDSGLMNSFQRSEEEMQKRFAAIVEERVVACQEASELYRDQPTAQNRAALIDAIGNRTPLCNSHERAGVMVSMLYLEPPEIFWPVFMDTWPICDDSWYYSGIVLGMMRDHKPALEYMPPEIRAAYDALPDLVEVWRGTDRKRVRNFSWTMKSEKAEFFAVHRRGAPFPNPVVAHAFIPKEHVFYADNGRNEAEVVLDPRRLRKLTVESAAHLALEWGKAS